MRAALSVGLAAALMSGPPQAEAAQDEAARLERPINCTIRASRQIEMSPVFDGVVAEVFVSAGDPVRAGEALMRLNTDLDEAELAFQEARARA